MKNVIYRFCEFCPWTVFWARKADVVILVLNVSCFQTFFGQFRTFFDHFFELFFPDRSFVLKFPFEVVAVPVKFEMLALLKVVRKSCWTERTGFGIAHSQGCQVWVEPNNFFFFLYSNFWKRKKSQKSPGSVFRRAIFFVLLVLVVSISAFFSILCKFLHKGAYYSIFCCFPFYSSDDIVSQKTSKWNSI